MHHTSCSATSQVATFRWNRIESRSWQPDSSFVTLRWRKMDSNHRFRATTSFVSYPRRTSPVSDDPLRRRSCLFAKPEGCRRAPPVLRQPRGGEEPMVRRLTAGGKWIRTIRSAEKETAQKRGPRPTIVARERAPPSLTITTSYCCGILQSCTRSMHPVTQARMRERSRRTLASSSFSSRRCFTRSPILTMPFSSFSSITGK